jgi:choline dehydrogenase
MRATRVLLLDRRAEGVAYRRGGEERTVYAAREMILAGGPINSPQLLKLSGVGPAGELRALGIEVVQELRGVGENLHDHLEFYFQVECREPVTLYSAMSPLAKAWIGMRWLLRRDGLGATNHFETGGFV